MTGFFIVIAILVVVVVIGVVGNEIAGKLEAISRQLNRLGPGGRTGPR